MADPSAPSLRDRIAQAVHEEQSVDAVLAVLADADPTDLGLVELAGYCPIHGGIVVWEDGIATCDGDDGNQPCVVDPLYARPRTEEAHTVDVGFVHVLTEDGACTPACPHPDHRTEEGPRG